MALNKIKTCYWNGFGVPQNRDKGDEVHALITRIHGWDLLDFSSDWIF